MIEITKDIYRLALHSYLIYAYPDDDVEYYSKWAWLVNDFWVADFEKDHPFPTEVRFGCHISGNTKLRCYPSGFMFDTNHGGDPPEMIEQLKEMRDMVEDEWRKHGIPVHSDRFKEDRA